MLVKIELCQQCAQQLRTVLAQRGEKAMAAVVGKVLQTCETCKQQFPMHALDELSPSLVRYVLLFEQVLAAWTSHWGREATEAQETAEHELLERMVDCRQEMTTEQLRYLDEFIEARLASWKQAKARSNSTH
jgi:hypothetical protein